MCCGVLVCASNAPVPSAVETVVKCFALIELRNRAAYPHMRVVFPWCDMVVQVQTNHHSVGHVC